MDREEVFEFINVLRKLPKEWHKGIYFMTEGARFIVENSVGGE